MMSPTSSEGLSDEAIVTEIVEQNLFQYPTEKSITRMAKACMKRLHALEDETLGFLFFIRNKFHDVSNIAI